MAVTLTPNAVVAIANGAEDLKPLVQVLDVKQIGSSQNVQDRYRMLISDGSFLQQAMLATQLNEFVRTGEVQKGSIVKLSEFICNTINNRKIVIVLSMEVIVPRCEIIGDPKQLDSATLQQQQQQQPHQQQQQRPSMLGQQPVQRQSPPQAQSAQQFNSSYPSNFRAGGNMNSVPQSIPNPRMENVPGVSGPANVSGTSSGSFAKSMPSAGNSLHTMPNAAGLGSTPGRGLNPQSTVYGRTGSSVSYQPSPLYSNRGPIARNEAPPRIVPISALNPYQGRWTIKARVTSKGDRRRYNNARGDGQVFSFDLLDSEGGEIRVTGFNSVVDTFYDRIEAGKVYLISKGNLKPATKNFNHLNNEWEILLDSASTVELCPEEDNSIPKLQFNFKSIGDIEQMENNATVDVIGIVTSINPATSIMRKNGTEALKRSLQLKDESGCSVELTMWGSLCSKEGQQLQDLCDAGNFPVLALKCGRVSDFGGKSISTISPSHLLINPDFPKAHTLRNWFERERKNAISQSLTKEVTGVSRLEQRKTVAQIKDEDLGRSERPDWITIKATISFIKVDSFCYTACPLITSADKTCNKKVSNNGDGTWRCERCDRSMPECDYRYLLQAQIQDHTGVTWITAFQEAGEEIMGQSAKALYMLKHEGLEVEFSEAIRKVLFNQYLFKLKVKEETYNDEQRVKSTVVKVDRIDYSSECKILLDLIGKLARGEPINAAPMADSNLGRNIEHGYTGYSNITGGNSNTSFANNNFGGISSVNSSSACFKCGKPGHFAKDCPNNAIGYSSGGTFGGYGNSGTNNSSSSCFKCGQGGHWARDCPGVSTLPAAHGMRTGYGGSY